MATLLIGASACQKEPPPEPSPPPASSVAPASPGSFAAKRPAPRPETKLVWDEPSGWSRQGSRSAMRIATYKIPRAGADAEDAELAVFYFGPGGAGGVEANVQRWTKQFKDLDPSAVKRSERAAHGLTQHVIEVERGTYETGMPGAPTSPRKEYGMIAVIVETDAGPYFFKLTGPAATVSASRSTLFTLLDSVRLPPS